MKKILLLLANGFETFEASVYIDVIGWNLELGDGSTQLYTAGMQKEVKSTFNQCFVVDYLIDDINVNEFDALAIPGGFEVYGFYKDAYHEKFSNLIKAFYNADKFVSSICVAALPIAKTGILKNKKGTIYSSEIRRKELSDFGVDVVDQPIVQEGKITTSWNPSTAVDVALLLLQQLTSKENADKIKKLMGFL